ncbi:hypothetical protein ABPG72_010311 [Tetrahymena utriculariae]
MDLTNKNPIKTTSFTIQSLKIEKASQDDSQKLESFEIPETQVCISIFSNIVNVTITQTSKIGNIIEAYSENIDDLTNDDKIYEVRTLFGQRDIDLYELIARSIIDLFYNKERIFEFMVKQLQLERPDPYTFVSPFYGKQLILNISLLNIKNQQIHQDIFNHIMKNFQFSFMEFML